MRLYLSGPMTGLPDFNYPKFNEYAKRLREKGHFVFNPAESFNGRTDLDRAEYYKEDVKALTNVEAVALMSGWERSVGSNWEIDRARDFKLPILDADTLEPIADAIIDRARLGEVRVTDPKTGGQKGQKIQRFDLLPAIPLRQISEVYGHGAKKYSDRNWEKGYAWSLSYGALGRHINQFWAGEDTDSESGLPHLAHAAFHIFAMLEFMRTHPEKDDRPASPLVTKFEFKDGISQEIGEVRKNA